jgi:hypothetical protein
MGGISLTTRDERTAKGEVDLETQRVRDPRDDSHR